MNDRTFTGFEIRLLRVRTLRMTQEQFGAALGGVTVHAINRWENGIEPKPSRLAQRAILNLVVRNAYTKDEQ